MTALAFGVGVNATVFLLVKPSNEVAVSNGTDQSSGDDDQHFVANAMSVWLQEFLTKDLDSAKYPADEPSGERSAVKRSFSR